MGISTRSNHYWICLQLMFCLVIWTQFKGTEEAEVVPLVILHNAVTQGAVCLDGSPPAYQWDAGKGEGARNWLVSLQGGGWCLNDTIVHTIDNETVHSCTSRAISSFGSSLHMTPLDFSGVFNNDAKVNYFYNWNRVIVRYCDGGSFSGDAEKPDPVTKLYYRGARIFEAIIKELMTKGLRDAKNVIFRGGSAGGLGAMIHCSRFRSLFPKNVRVKCWVDASFFLHVKNSTQAKFFDTVFGTIVDLHQTAKALPAECTSKQSPLSCFFPQSLVQYVKSPIYILNSAFDKFQIQNTFSEDLHLAIKNHTVSPSDMAMLKDFRQQLISALPPPSATNGFLITSLYTHSFGPYGLKRPMFPNKNSKTLESALLDWFFDRRPINIVDPNDEPYYEE